MPTILERCTRACIGVQFDFLNHDPCASTLFASTLHAGTKTCHTNTTPIDAPTRSASFFLERFRGRVASPVRVTSSCDGFERTQSESDMLVETSAD